MANVRMVRAQWDYDALEDNEISFKAGDMIELIEAHNDDWFEGKFKGVAGYFPANRVVPVDPESDVLTPDGRIDGDNPFDDDDPPPGAEPVWKQVKSPNGDTYYWNVNTGETTWKAPPQNEILDEGPAVYEADSSSSNNLARVESRNTLRSSFFGWETDMNIEPAISGLSIMMDQFDSIPPELIRREGGLGKKLKKVVGGKEPRSQQSWRTYWGVVCIGWLVLYKDPPNKKKPEKVSPVDIIPLVEVTIESAGKDQTKKKNAFALSITGGAQWLLLPSNESEASKWIQTIKDSAKEFCTEDEYDSALTKVFCKDMSTVEKEQMARQKKPQAPAYKAPAPEERKPETKPKPTKRVDSASDDTDKSNVRAKLGGFFSRNRTGSEDLKKSKTSLVEDLVFGGSLSQQVAKDNSPYPSVVEACIQEVERRGLQSQGIYRLSGNASTIQKIRIMFNSQEAVRFEDEPDINVVAAVLKLYFRELQNPLVPFEFYEEFIEAAKISDYNERLMQIKALIHSLPKCNFETFQYLIQHLQKVAAEGEINKMEPPNLAIVFGPTLIRAPEDGQTAMMNMMNMSFHNQIVETILVQADWMFTADSDDEGAAQS
ncbi:hypothetical protein SmJEL517_g01634 [Synchytrium microbalum]|uniref:Rho GTPase-activating protein 27 n=1 Tax=Synchytrium microbalum TaxID=1806994 RepID=A0A507CE57_9FUNG|nr:uncharacterized protein SmJEL517_g01634 [Synchytrium microbalum]TPX36326.1 hypothetical protein SmJEL517_g01634 [Synchytrium microbalum]